MESPRGASFGQTPGIDLGADGSIGDSKIGHPSNESVSKKS